MSGNENGLVGTGTTRRDGGQFSSSTTTDSSDLVVLSVVLNKKQTENNEVASAIERLRQNGVSCFFYSMNDIRNGTISNGCLPAKCGLTTHHERPQHLSLVKNLFGSVEEQSKDFTFFTKDFEMAIGDLDTTIRNEPIQPETYRIDSTKGEENGDGSIPSGDKNPSFITPEQLKEPKIPEVKKFELERLQISPRDSDPSATSMGHQIHTEPHQKVKRALFGPHAMLNDNDSPIPPPPPLCSKSMTNQNHPAQHGKSRKSRSRPKKRKAKRIKALSTRNRNNVTKLNSRSTRTEVTVEQQGFDVKDYMPLRVTRSVSSRIRSRSFSPDIMANCPNEKWTYSKAYCQPQPQRDLKEDVLGCTNTNRCAAEEMDSDNVNAKAEALGLVLESVQVEKHPESSSVNEIISVESGFALSGNLDDGLGLGQIEMADGVDLQQELRSGSRDNDSDESIFEDVKRLMEEIVSSVVSSAMSSEPTISLATAQEPEDPCVQKTVRKEVQPGADLELPTSSPVKTRYRANHQELQFYSSVADNVRRNLSLFLDGTASSPTQPQEVQRKKRFREFKNGYLLHHGDNNPDDPESPYKLHLSTQILVKLNNRRRSKILHKEDKGKSLLSYLKLIPKRPVRGSGRAPARQIPLDPPLESKPISNSSSCESSVLTGEWVIPRRCICRVCGQTEDYFWNMVTHKGEEHPGVVVTHVELGETQEAPPSLIRNLPPEKSLSDQSITPLSSCTKCNTSFGSLHDLHQHIFECAGNAAWLVEKTPKKKNNRRRRGFKRRLSNPLKKSSVKNKQPEGTVCPSSKNGISVIPRRRGSSEPYKCIYCRREFKTEGWLKNHMMSHSVKVSIPLEKLPLASLPVRASFKKRRCD